MKSLMNIAVAIVLPAIVLPISGCSGGDSSPRAQLPTLATIARKCEDYHVNLYDSGKYQVLDSSGTNLVNGSTDGVDCIIEKGKVPQSIADRITEAQQAMKSGHDDVTQDGREYIWSVSVKKVKDTDLINVMTYIKLSELKKD